MIMSADQCRDWVARLPDRICCCYTLWDRLEQIPVYVGTAKSPSRIRSHLQKDTVRQGNLGKLVINPPFYAYVMNRPVGWLGISAEIFGDDVAAHEAEVALIARYGMRPSGTLFNRRASG